MNHNYGAYVHTMNQEEYQIISYLIKDGGIFLMSPQEGTKVQKTAQRIVKLKRFRENLFQMRKNRNTCLSNKHLDISFES